MPKQVVLFSGYAPNGHTDLWVTDGTVAGTYDLTGITGAYFYGITPTYPDIFGSQIAFAGIGTAEVGGTHGFWLTDGTAAGTYETGVIPGLLGSPYNFTTVNGKLLFFGAAASDAGAALGVWLSDGTTGGTVQVPGALALYGPAYQPLVLGNVALFEGQNAAGHYGLWATDGTIAGTREILGQSALTPAGLAVNDMVNYGNRIVFDGAPLIFLGVTTGSFDNSLWTTDGTAAGTYEIGGQGGIAGAYVAPAGSTPGIELDPSYITVMNGELYFNGHSANGNYELWQSNGSAGGTSAVSGVLGAATTGLNPLGITALGNLLVFGGASADGKNHLWVSDGTGAGTHMLTVAGLLIGSAVSFQVVNGLALFTAYDSLGKVQMWATDGSAGGTYELANVAGANNAGIGLFPESLSAPFSIQGHAHTGSQTTYDPLTGIVSTLYTGDSVDPYSSYEFDTLGAVSLETRLFYTVVAMDYSSSGIDQSAGGAQIGSQYFYTPAGAAYAKRELDLDGANRLVAQIVTGVTGAAYSAYEYDYIGGVLSTLKVTYTTVPTGADYSSYEFDYTAGSVFAGAKYFYTTFSGRPYANAEVDTNSAGVTTRVLLGGATGQTYAELELDYAGTGGAYSGEKVFYSGAGSQTYARLEEDVSATGVLTKAVYTGLSNTPYVSLQQDFTGGALSDAIYGFNNVSGASYYAYQVEEDASGAVLQETLDLNNGGHDIFAVAAGQTLTSLGADLMNGATSGVTSFYFNQFYGADEIANFNSNDKIYLTAGEFGDLASAISGATNVGVNVRLDFGDGNTLTIDGLNKTGLQALSGDFLSHG